MPKLIHLPTFSDNRGQLTVIEKILPFDIKRVYYIYQTGGKKGATIATKLHRHLLLFLGVVIFILKKKPAVLVLFWIIPKNVFY